MSSRHAPFSTNLMGSKSSRSSSLSRICKHRIKVLLKKPRHQQTFKDQRRLLAGMGRDFDESEAVLIQQQREYEDRVHREERELVRQKR